jgi:nucleoside 2-deoxyribosyltransferase
VKTRVYLAGPINGRTDAQANDWRQWVASRFLSNVEVLDPMRRDYRGKEAENVEAIIEGDKNDISSSDVLIVNALEGGSWGTAMELVYASLWNKYIIAVVPEGKMTSPWLVGHSSVRVHDFQAAVDLAERWQRAAA